MHERLKKLSDAYEMVSQALLGCNWEERFELLNLQEKIREEIRRLTSVNG